MVKVTTSPSGLSPATDVGSPRARSDSANSADSTDTATMAAMDATADKARSIQFDDEALRGHGSEEDDEGEDEEEKAEFGDVKTSAELLGEGEELSLQVSQMGRPLPVGRDLAAELEDDADDDDDDDEKGVAPGDRPPLIPRATRNADTPSANRVLVRLGEEMRSESELMMMFAPVAMTQAKWPVLGPELTQPVNRTDINQLVEDTVLLLKTMGFRCNGRPNSLILGDWSLSRAGAEILKWKTTTEAGVRPGTARGKPADDRATNSRSPKTLKGRSAQSDDDRDYRDNAEDSAKDVIRRLSLDDAERDRGHYLEVGSHGSLAKIAEFEGKRYRSDDSLQWLKRFIHEMKGTRISQDSWCEPFTLCLGRAAKSWYRQLPKKTQRKWNLISEAFLDYYRPQFEQSARTRYYSARRKENEPICEFLIRLNGYARTAKIQYGKGGADASDHVEHFLLNCGDDDIMDLLYPMRLDDIESQRRPESTRLNESRKGERRDDRRDVRPSDDEKSDEAECQPSRRLGQLDYDDDDSDSGRDGDLDSEEESDHDYIDAGLANEKSRSGNSREDSARPQWNSVRQRPNSASHWNPVNPSPDHHSRVGRSSDRQDNYGRRGDSRERPPVRAMRCMWRPRALSALLPQTLQILPASARRGPV
ncbi:unnamed protein product [Phytophthora fragariaefolia]|uniref:Unnamed protein product n=1 Tax=Phytophthora fragariaefolia TaxID=1490495 RepID=A0A9W6YBM8_9STRA|nr:unnamed protein product [Phytophthora fragariaefolia]